MEAVRTTTALVGSRVQRVRIGRVHDHICYPGVLIHIKDTGPSGPAVRGLIQTTLPVRSPQVSHGCHINHVRIAGMHHNTADVVAITQAHIHPRLTGVDRLVHTVSPG